MEIQRICSVLGFSGLPNSKDQKRTKIRLVGFRVPKNNEKSRFVSLRCLGWDSKEQNTQDLFLSVLRRWIYRFSLRFLGVEYTGLGFWLLDVEYIICFDFRFLGFGYVGFNFQFLGFGYMGFDFWLGFGYMGKFPLQIFGWVSLSDFCQIAE
ncbi:uncharacterized protein OCT59_012241 [Rhizophagus irregularis]|uniref:uncharacterized protein n=1 Tax=Rhizophagus irregularis TaxID=588596 RepID=UPI00332C01AF|nr:hypothetical protein OCT59_012241 [Rhizophagus irregularis]